MRAFRADNFAGVLILSPINPFAGVSFARCRYSVKGNSK